MDKKFKVIPIFGNDQQKLERELESMDAGGFELIQFILGHPNLLICRKRVTETVRPDRTEDASRRLEASSLREGNPSDRELSQPLRTSDEAVRTQGDLREQTHSDSALPNKSLQSEDNAPTQSRPSQRKRLKLESK